ncbi:hypothetical protein BGZ96_009079 [Linnemannia gamsii]|uniref:Tail specific protease domain-containing protein n=1 Tax=Linnemannia gamsii TaxID=64522 RepID=A0ABQ7JX05_9FUNG|nr:hypothetical protein BGZ96_009079 [Linnemannia gamsii]
MVVIPLKSIVLAASLVALVSAQTTTYTPPHPSPAPTPPSTIPAAAHDVCGILGTSLDHEITYEKVAACYKSVPFNSKVAATTLESVITIFDDFYAFRDSALAPNLAKPFTAGSVDILKKLKTIGRTNYTSDHQYHHELSLAIISLKDAHASYAAQCYNNYVFAQSFSLYAPVVNGKQIIQVYSDYKHRGYEGCTVHTIDGEDALLHINAWTDVNMDFSKDAGVRLNQALSSLRYDPTSGEFGPLNGDFSLRSMLPEKAYIDYGLVCPNSTTVVPVREAWSVFPISLIKFDSRQTFVQNVCESSPSISTVTGSSQKRQLYQPELHPLIPQVKKNPFKHASVIVDDAVSLPPVEAIGSVALFGVPGQASVVYRLDNRPDVGVVHVWTHNMEDEATELTSLVNNLTALSQDGVRNIIIDFQGNFGGLISFASTFVQLFFPNKDPFDKTLPSNLRVTESIQQLSKALLNSSSGLYDATSFYDYANNHLYANNELFMNMTTSIRNGRTAKYTEKTTVEPSVLPVIKELAALPWTNRTANIRLLTDGRCGSSCSMSTFFLTQFHKVISYTVGGTSGEPMSASSFPGGAVTSLNKVHDLYVASNVPSPFKPLPYNGDVRYTALEVFAPGSNTPLDYDTAYYASDYRLDFSPLNAKSREVLWEQVAASAWPL